MKPVPTADRTELRTHQRLVRSTYLPQESTNVSKFETIRAACSTVQQRRADTHQFSWLALRRAALTTHNGDTDCDPDDRAADSFNDLSPIVERLDAVSQRISSFADDTTEITFDKILPLTSMFLPT